jgi:hypothetical protein
MIITILCFCFLHVEFNMVGAAAPPLIGASLSWKVDRMFISGTRMVSFTLRSAFNVSGLTNCAKLITADKTLINTFVSTACTPAIDVDLAFGHLCFDQFVDPSLSPPANLLCNAQNNNRAANNFKIQNYDFETIKGVTIVYGELQANFTVSPQYNFVAAYLDRADKAPEPDGIASFTNAMYTSPSTNGYWNGLPPQLLNSDQWSNQRTPACTTFVRLCEAARCGNASAGPPNYFSPNPLLPLLLPAPSQNVALKAMDYDGHPMVRARGNSAMHDYTATIKLFNQSSCCMQHASDLDGHPSERGSVGRRDRGRWAG